jgi:hypothetical protein
MAADVKASFLDHGFEYTHTPLPMDSYQQLYGGKGLSAPIVLDVGSYCLRAGWAAEAAPRVVCRSLGTLTPPLPSLFYYF